MKSVTYLHCDLQRLEKTFEESSDTSKYFTGEDIDFFAAFLLRDIQSDLNKDITIIPSTVAYGIRHIVDYLLDSCDELQLKQTNIDENKALQTSIKHLDIYLFSNPNIVKSQLIFLVINDMAHHWHGICALNACLNSKGNSGYIPFDSLNHVKEEIKESRNQMYLVFFNLALYYYQANNKDHLSYIYFHENKYKKIFSCNNMWH